MQPVAQASIDRHPKGLYVLFASEMWERFSFYTMLSMFTLYLMDREQGFGWARERATDSTPTTRLACNLSPLVGGWLADRFLGYRRSAMIGAMFFVAGHLLLSFHSIAIMYAALACLVVGNGFFKPNITAMVGDLYPDESPAQGPRIQHLLHGHQHRRVPRSIVARSSSNRFGFHPAFRGGIGGNACLGGDPVEVQARNRASGFRRRPQPREREIE